MGRKILVIPWQRKKHLIYRCRDTPTNSLQAKRLIASLQVPAANAGRVDSASGRVVGSSPSLPGSEARAFGNYANSVSA